MNCLLMTWPGRTSVVSPRQYQPLGYGGGRPPRLALIPGRPSGRCLSPVTTSWPSARIVSLTVLSPPPTDSGGFMAGVSTCTALNDVGVGAVCVFSSAAIQLLPGQPASPRMRDHEQAVRMDGTARHHPHWYVIQVPELPTGNHSGNGHYRVGKRNRTAYAAIVAGGKRDIRSVRQVLGAIRKPPVRIKYEWFMVESGIMVNPVGAEYELGVGREVDPLKRDRTGRAAGE